MTVLPAPLALHEAVGGVGPFDIAGFGEEPNAFAYPINVSRRDSNNSGSGSFRGPFYGVRLKVAGVEDGNVSRIAN